MRFAERILLSGHYYNTSQSDITKGFDCIFAQFHANRLYLYYSHIKWDKGSNAPVGISLRGDAPHRGPPRKISEDDLRRAGGPKR